MIARIGKVYTSCLMFQSYLCLIIITMRYFKKKEEYKKKKKKERETEGREKNHWPTSGVPVKSAGQEKDQVGRISHLLGESETRPVEIRVRNGSIYCSSCPGPISWFGSSAAPHALVRYGSFRNGTSPASSNRLTFYGEVNSTRVLDGYSCLRMNPIVDCSPRIQFLGFQPSHWGADSKRTAFDTSKINCMQPLENWVEWIWFWFWICCSN